MFASSSRRAQKRSKPSKSSRSAEEKMFRETIERKEILSTKFFCDITLDCFELTDFTAALLSHAGLKDFHHLTALTHPAMTREFLTTLTFEFTENKILKWLSFEYEGQRYTMSAADVREAFSISGEPSEAWGIDTVGTRPTDWWQLVTGTIHGTERDTYNYSIPNPALVLCHKVFAMCFCGKGEVNKIPAVDLQYLWSVAPECPMIPDWAGLFVSRCHDARTKSAGKIAMGGMITLLVKQFVDIVPLEKNDSTDPPVKGGHLYSNDWLESHHIVHRLVDRFEWLWPFGRNDDTFIHLPKRLRYGPSPTFRLPADDTTGMVPVSTACKKKLAQLQRARERAAPQVPVHDEEAADNSAGHQGPWDRLWARLDQIDATATERHNSLRQEIAGVRTAVADVRAEQARGYGYWQQFYDYEKGQWDQYWTLHPPPPPPGQF